MPSRARSWEHPWGLHFAQVVLQPPSCYLSHKTGNQEELEKTMVTEWRLLLQASFPPGKHAHPPNDHPQRAKQPPFSQAAPHHHAHLICLFPSLFPSPKTEENHPCDGTTMVVHVLVAKAPSYQTRQLHALNLRDATWEKDPCLLTVWFKITVATLPSPTIFALEAILENLLRMEIMYTIPNWLWERYEIIVQTSCVQVLCLVVSLRKSRQHGVENWRSLCCRTRASLVAQIVKNQPALQETRVQSLGQEDALEKGMTTTPVFLPGESHGQRSLQGYSPCSCRVGHNTMLQITH